MTWTLKPKYPAALSPTKKKTSAKSHTRHLFQWVGFVLSFLDYIFHFCYFIICSMQQLSFFVVSLPANNTTAKYAFFLRLSSIRSQNTWSRALARGPPEWRSQPTFAVFWQNWWQNKILLHVKSYQPVAGPCKGVWHHFTGAKENIPWSFKNNF